MKLVEVLKVVVVVVVVMISESEAIWLELPPSEVKCVYEDLRNNILVLANYVVIHDDEDHAQANIPLPTVSVEVQSPLGNNLHHEENVTYGQFGFTTTEAGNHVACFRMNSHVPGNKSVSIALEWKTGIDAKDWDSIARKEKIEGVALELMKLEGLVQAIRNNLVYLRKRERGMRRLSEKTNAAVARFSILSLGICILAATLQIWYLKRFFRKKKLI